MLLADKANRTTGGFPKTHDHDRLRGEVGDRHRAPIVLQQAPDLSRQVVHRAGREHRGGDGVFGMAAAKGEIRFRGGILHGGSYRRFQRESWAEPARSRLVPNAIGSGIPRIRWATPVLALHFQHRMHAHR
ncbi:MAG: hypothetical protein ACYTE2_03895 [Planctomycetota bacterium]